jgi:hypothetical protein
MVGQPSASTSFYQAVYDASIPPSNAPCSDKQLDYRTKFDDLNENLTIYKNSGCIADADTYAEEIEREMTAKEDLVNRYTVQKATFDSYIESVDVLQNARGPFDTYMQDLNSQQSSLAAEQVEMEQRIRAGRRRFLDADPQSGVTSILGMETTDDKVLLVFWICFTLGIMSGALVFLRIYGDALQLLTVQQKVTVFLGVLLFSMGVAFYFIRQYA